MSDDAVWYGRLSGRFWRHPKALALSAGAGWLWTRALSYVVDQRTDGVVASAALKALEPRHGTKLAAELVASGLWEPHPSGHVFHDFADHGLTVEAWEAKKKKDRDRKAKSRDPSQVGHGGGHAPLPPDVTRDKGVTTSVTPSREDSGLRTQDSGLRRSEISGERSGDLVARELPTTVSSKLSPEGSAWVHAFEVEYKRATGGLPSSIVHHLPKLIASGADPKAACAGFFATPRHARTRPPFRADLLAEDPVGYASCANPSPVSHPSTFEPEDLRGH